MSNIPSDLEYTASHEWVRRLANGKVEVGITDHAQHALGDLVFVEVPAVERRLAAGEACCVVESVKAASDVYCPIGGRVVASNTALAERPELLNQDPYGAAWLFSLEVEGEPAAKFLSAAEYAQLIEKET